MTGVRCRPHGFELLSRTVEPGELRQLPARARLVRENAVLRGREDRGSAGAEETNLFGHGEGLSGETEAIRVEGPGEESAFLPEEQMSSRSAGREWREGDVRSAMEEEPSIVRIERRQKDAGGVLGPGSPRSIAQVEKVTPVRQKERPGVTELSPARVDPSHGRGGSPRGSHSMNRIAGGWDEEDHAVAVPRPSTSGRCVAERLG